MKGDWRDDPSMAWYAAHLDRAQAKRDALQARGPLVWWAWNLWQFWKRRYPEIISGSLWLGLFLLLLPYEFRHNQWDNLTLKILGSVIGSAVLPAPLTVPLYLVLSSR
jgi:hypothetical protein